MTLAAWRKLLHKFIVAIGLVALIAVVSDININPNSKLISLTNIEK